jgi:hypothetical protein
MKLRKVDDRFQVSGVRRQRPEVKRLGSWEAGKL